jgi:glycosyltransferase involved in cell wall biosynthesis
MRGNESRKILFLTKYGPRAASTRFRVLQYLPYLGRAGFDCEVRPLFSDKYLAFKLDRGQTSYVEVVAAGVRRLAALVGITRFAVVVIHMEAMPYLPPFFERALVRMRVPYVYDFDDASFHLYDRSKWSIVRRMLSSKIARIIEGAALVVAGNEYLAEYAVGFNKKVEIVPTVVDVDRFKPRAEGRNRERVVIGWIGSPSTADYVVERRRVWQRINSDGRSTMRLIGAGRLTPSGVNAEVRPWREEREIADIQDFDIGIMPLSDDPWARGKSGFKLIEYLACGVPVVASPVGANCRIVVPDTNGFLCDTDDEWVEKLRLLIADAERRRRMGINGRQLVCRDWSLQRYAPKLTQLIIDAATA